MTAAGSWVPPRPDAAGYAREVKGLRLEVERLAHGLASADTGTGGCPAYRAGVYLDQAIRNLERAALVLEGEA